MRPRGQASRRKRTAQPGPARLVVPAALAVCLFLVLVIFATAGKPGGDDQGGTKGAAQKASSRSGSKGSKSKQASGKRSADAQDGANAQTGRALYKVKSGDSFGAIAEKTGVDARDLAELNPDVDPRALQPGQRLKLR